MGNNVVYLGATQPAGSERSPAISTSAATDVGVLCLWAAVGLAMTAVVFALGFGAEVVQALSVAG
jgi:hypothetical protein